MRVSIVTVCFNSAATIVDTLRSVVGQTHPEVEHVIIDGGSSDGTLGLIRQHARAGYLLVSEPDKGIYDAMNKGLRLATGDLIGFLNADDALMHPDVIADLTCLVSEAGADVVYGDLVYVQRLNSERVVRHWSSGRFTRTRLAWGWMPPHPTFYVRRTLIGRLGNFDTSLRIAADYDLMLRYLKEPQLVVAYLPQLLVKMKTGGASNSSLRALLRKSSEDYRVIRRHNMGGLLTLLSKNFRKLGQLWTLGASRSRHDLRLP